jgi:2'-5' RNA ligase
MIRLFIALGIKQSIKNYLAEIINEFKSKGGKIKWVEPDNMHLTLKFLGNTEYSLVDGIKVQLDSLKADLTPIKSDLCNLGGFPNLKKPKVIWIDLEKNRDQIIELAKRIDTSLAEIGFASESKLFKPHLTLGRIKKDDDLEKLTDYLTDYELKRKDLVFDTISLIKSTLTNDGPIYKSLHTINFSDKFAG